MSVDLIVERQLGLPAIALNEWLSLLASDPELRRRREPYWASKPATGHQFEINVGEADSEVLQHEHWEPFLRFQRGRLVTQYSDKLSNPTDFRRCKILEVAAKLGARICTDVDDEPVEW